MQTVQRTSLQTLAVLVVLSFASVFSVDGQSTKSGSRKTIEEIPARAEKSAKNEEILTPLTAEERALDPREVISNQPDFAADLSYFVGEGFGGYGFAQRMVRKGNRYREESQFWIFVGELGKPSARLFPKAKLYNDFEPPQ